MPDDDFFLPGRLETEMPRSSDQLLWKQLLRRSTRDILGLQGQIREMLVSAIFDGLLLPDKPIPSSRDMAEHLGVARNTVVLSYRQLAEDGYLIARERRGYYINPNYMLTHHAQAMTGYCQKSRAVHGYDWTRRLRIQPTAQRSIIKPTNWQEFTYPFLYGQFDASLFPTAHWRECCQRALSVLDIRAWAPDHINRDDDALLQQICTRVLPRRGVWIRPEEVVITVGAQHALYLIADLLMHSDTRVAIEDPGYPDARNIFASRTPNLLPLPVDGDGLIVDHHLDEVDYVYVTPSHQCPTGVTMSLERRLALLEKADERDFIIIEDDFESENCFSGEPLPALKSLDRNNRVIYVSSLSKSWAPGLRLGYVAGSAELIDEVRALRRLMLRHPSAFIQRAFALFLSLGYYDAQLYRVAIAQRERCAILRGSLTKYAPECGVTPALGGGSIWVLLPHGVDTRELYLRCINSGVLVELGDVFFFESPPPLPFLRLGYQSIPNKSIEPGVALLARIILELKE
jgi:GntR family transcriptional regulator/MocR family aminotransferase